MPAPPGLTVDARALQQVRRSLQLLRATGSESWQRARCCASNVVPRDEAAGLLLAFAYPDRIGLARGGESSGVTC